MPTYSPTTFVGSTRDFDVELAADVRSALADTGLIRISDFPADVPTYIAFLSMFGTPLGYYGDDTGTHPAHSAIWRIKYEPEAAASGEVHAMAGPLAPHSSQSMRSPRPPLFSMLMVDQGWQDRASGENGESLFVRWSDAIELVRSKFGANAVASLFSEVPFPDGVARSVAYALPAARNQDDLGVRFKSDLVTHLRSVVPGHPATIAAEHLAAAAAQVAKRVQLASGDLVLLDNDRWGHGRESVVGHRSQADGEVVLNPRELWSVTIG